MPSKPNSGTSPTTPFPARRGTSKRSVFPIYQEVRRLLLDRGWEIDVTAKEDGYGVLKEYVHPETRKRMGWHDALGAELDREEP